MKGRNPNLIELRNRFLIKRYYYWHDIQRLRLDDVITKLSVAEVFLDEDYIRRVIRNNIHLLKQLRKASIKSNKLDDFEFEETLLPSYTNGSLFAVAN